MEFLPENSRFGIKTELECALEQDFVGLEMLVRQEIEAGGLGAVYLSNEEDFLVQDFYETLNDVPDEVDEEVYEIAERAVKLAKLLYHKATYAALPVLFEPSEADEDDEAEKFASGVHKQLADFDATSPATTDLIQRLSVELDFSGDHSYFAVAVVKLSCIAIENTALVQGFHMQRTRPSFDDALALWLDEAS
jgi:hypothetical protein